MSKLSFNQLSGMNCHYAHHTFDYFLDSLASNGMYNVEIWGASPHVHVDDASPKVIKEARKALGSRDFAHPEEADRQSIKAFRHWIS